MLMENDLDADYVSKREEKLGFKPQKEIVYNRLLHYSDVIDDESSNMLAEIKGYLGKFVLLREMRPGCVVWIMNINSYIMLYGMKFSKEDHILFIKLFYEVITIPSLEPFMIEQFSNTLAGLLKKKELISPEDLTLPWRPLYDLYHQIFQSSRTNLGMYRYVSTLAQTLASVVHGARFYFGPSATKEILEEGRPLLCPFELCRMGHAINFFEWFLPIHLPPHQSHLGHKLWLDEFLDLWSTCHNTPSWEKEMMWLMARLAQNNIGYIDWEPHVPLMFTRFLRSMNLPVNYKKYNIGAKPSRMDTTTIAIWIVSTLGGGSSTQRYLEKFMKSLESYFHPANTGRWLGRLKDILYRLSYHFFLRVRKERYRKLTWETPVPPEKKLTEEDITMFVEGMKPALMTAMFSRLGSSDIGQAMRHLATLRPELIIPSVIETMYSTADSLTEPHKYTAAMHCTASLARPLLEGAKHYPEGPTHIVPLLLASLPGIDPNDVHKCFMTFQLISSFASVISFVDCSSASEHWNDLTPEEEIVCSSTSQMEDFVVQFLDRCFTFIENSSLETTRLEQDSDKRSRLESMTEGVIASTIISMLNQTSPAIYTVAVQKLVKFVKSRILETKVAGRSLATICSGFGRVNPEQTLKLLVPHLCETILTITESEEVLKEEVVDKELLYNLNILSELAVCQGIIPYMPQLENVLDRTLHASSRELYRMASKLLGRIFTSLSTVTAVENCISNKGILDDISQTLPIREWGKPGDLLNLNLKWHYPTESEEQEAQRLLSKYLPPELERIDKHVKDEQPLTREELQCSLSIIIHILECEKFLPIWEEPILNLSNSAVGPTHVNVFLGVNAVLKMPDGSNVRKTIAEAMMALQDKMLQDAKDDTKSLFHIISIWEALLLNLVRSESLYDALWKNYQMTKKFLGKRMMCGKRHQRPILVERVKLQHIKRATVRSYLVTATHREIFYRLFALSTSCYSAVRSKAQLKLYNAFAIYPYSYRLLVPKLVENLEKDPNQHHELFKGSLYVLLGPKTSSLLLNPIITRPDWEMLRTLWPALVKAKPSEKLSVIKLLENVIEVVHKHFPTVYITLQIPDSILELVGSLWSTCPVPSVLRPTSEEIIKGLETHNKRNEEAHELFIESLQSINDAILNNNLHWRFHTMAMNFLRDLVHEDVSYPPEIVKNFLNTLVHDSLELRKIAIRCTIFSLKQQKRPHKKQEALLDRSTVAHKHVSGDEHGVTENTGFGDRADNAWLQYNSSTLPKNEEDWNQMHYNHKLYIGYYAWPKVLMEYAPASEQPPLDRSRETMTLSEQHVYDFFSDAGNIEKLIKFHSMEDKKGKDKFNGFRFILFKSLFRNHGDAFLELFKPHLERLVDDKQESSQRCVAEIIAGLIRGCKHWPAEKVAKLWEYLVPLIRQALNNMTEETIVDWGICFATSSKNRDPNRNHWLFEVLMEDPLRNESSLIGCGRLYALQGALNQQEWKVSELYSHLLDYFQAHITHPFQNVRDRLGSVLTNIFETDLRSTNGIVRTRGPKVKDFVDSVIPQLNILYSLSSDNCVSVEPMETDCSDVGSSNTVLEKEVAIRLLKTVMKWIISSLSRAKYSGRPEYFELLPLVCLMENYENDDELNKVCSTFLAWLSKSLTVYDSMPASLNAIVKLSKFNSWTARRTCLQFLQVFIFHNMSTLISNASWVDMLSELVLRLLGDERPEVRETASQVLSGLIHCDFIPTQVQEELLAQFFKQCKTKVKKPEQKNATNGLVKKHAAILGLCSFISASPYDVPEAVPSIFLQLGMHLNDPQPIPSTIRKTLGDFKRTHHDNWPQHKLKFSEEQLFVLSDLTVPPSYYA